MAQAFVTTTNNDYRLKKSKRAQIYVPLFTHYWKNPIKGGDWINTENLVKASGEFKDVSNEEIKDILNTLIKDRYETMYELHYCKKDFTLNPIIQQNESSDDESELLKYCYNLYIQKKKKLLPTLPTSRRVYGYCRPTRFHSQLTTYQVLHGELAYHILNGDLNEFRESSNEKKPDIIKTEKKSKNKHKKLKKKCK